MGGFAAVKERPTGPLKTFEETDILRSSNTWEFLIFEQIRAIRFIQHTVFSEPRNAKFHILNLIIALNHLEGMLYYRINPSRDKTNEDWKSYVIKKPDVFKNLSLSIDELRHLANADEFTQFQLVAMAEDWFILLDKYLSGIKKIDAVAYEMKIPDHYDSVFEAEPGSPVNSGISPVSSDDPLGDESERDEIISI